jgi:uncharacterized protein (DUF433 family)
MPTLIQAEPLPFTEDADGVIRVGKTRVTLETIIGAFSDGASAEEIACQYPSVELADVYAAITYYLRHRAEVEGYLQRQEKRSGAVKRENLARFGQQGIRERLLARRKAQ